MKYHWTKHIIQKMEIRLKIPRKTEKKEKIYFEFTQMSLQY